MSQGGGSDDDFLRALARAPAIPLPADEVDPGRLAQFRIVARIGRGGMGIVYRAEDEKLRRTVALKVLPSAFTQDEERRRRFLREARSAAAITHPNIATVYDVGEADGRVFLAMELVEGETLRDRLARGAMPPAEALRVARAMARGLARAHGKGVVHRDLKPDNVMIDQDGEAKILDFGLAKLREAEAEAGSGKSALERAETASQITGEGRVLGTPQYMSPEQAKGVAVDARTDVFSLGVVLYEMLAGVRPFRGETSFDVLVAVTRDPPPPLRDRAPDTPPSLQAVVDRCLAKAPSERFASGKELAEALEAVPLGSAPHVAASSASRPHSPAASTRTEAGVAALSPALLRPRPRRRAAIAVALGLGASSVLALVIAMAVRRSPAPPIGPRAESSRGVAAPRGRAITEEPQPKTSSPEAAAAYAAGLQALRDGSVNIGTLNVERATVLDPHFAAANLRLAFMTPSLEGTRRQIAAVQQSRSLLEGYDPQLLELLEAHVRDPSAHDDIVRRALALAAAWPDDAEAQFWAASMLISEGREPDARPVLDRAMAIDPHFAGAEHWRALLEEDVDNLDAALASVDRCTAISPAAASCIRRRADIHAIRGECDKLEVDARATMAVEPKGPAAYTYLAAALAARGASTEALEQLYRKATELIPNPDEARRFGLDKTARVAIERGDFATGEARLLELEKEVATAADETEHRAESLISLYEEEGAPDKALAVADDFARRLPAWVHDSPNSGRALVLSVRRRAGHISDGEMRETRKAWMAEAQAQMVARDANAVWVMFYAWPAWTQADAREAMAVLPEYAPLPLHKMDPTGEGATGRVYLLAGDAQRAVPLLQAETTWCANIPMHGFRPEGIDWQIARIRDFFFLGQALEQTGDTRGACAAYGAVLDRWGKAKPRSLTAEKARGRSRALGCAP
jgi:serine/threonine-protein kinase